MDVCLPRINCSLNRHSQCIRSIRTTRGAVHPNIETVTNVPPPPTPPQRSQSCSAVLGTNKSWMSDIILVHFSFDLTKSSSANRNIVIKPIPKWCCYGISAIKFVSVHVYNDYKNWISWASLIDFCDGWASNFPIINFIAWYPCLF